MVVAWRGGVGVLLLILIIVVSLLDVPRGGGWRRITTRTSGFLRIDVVLLEVPVV